MCACSIFVVYPLCVFMCALCVCVYATETCPQVLRYAMYYALALLVAQYAFNLQSLAPTHASDLTRNLGLTDDGVLNSNVILAWLALVCLLLAGWLHLRPADEDKAAVEALHREMRQSGYNFSGPRPAPLRTRLHTHTLTRT